MTDKIALKIDLTPEESQSIAQKARAHGYETPAEYVHALVADAIKPLTARELLQLPLDERNKILEAMAIEAANDPDYMRTLAETEAFGEDDLYNETP